ncbi:conserved hypothetical protein [Candidatus Terasakiella magnetica]|uniref:DsbA family protein n=1 Tax=Candidatus Terasakiella magnetica TaxID=1867952 RepID=A0A1C3RFH9_9PROT|nr:DsbA family protein [Candidatus Terasakiella magnetica]SCA56053.1 conserved hypothetical protein [Candidatus Terasakiella magnetica]
MISSTLFYVHDPMCSWCWGHCPQWQKLKKNLPDTVMVKNIVGGLAPDSDAPMPMAQQQAISGYWKKIEGLLGTQFNYDFWTKNTPRRSTYPACRAVIAARWQNAEEKMILAIQEAYYLRAMNPSDQETHLQLASELDLDTGRFEADLNSQKLEQAFSEELQFAQSLPIHGFPSMVLQHDEKLYAIPLDYQDYRSGLTAITEIISQGA